MKTFQIQFTKTDNSEKRVEWFLKRFYRSMDKIIVKALERAKELDMTIVDIKRIN